MPELVPVALVALAGLGAALATQGVLRRIVGVVLLIGGALIAMRSRARVRRPPRPRWCRTCHDRPTRSARPGCRRGDRCWASPADCCIAVAGGLIVAGRGARRMSARYEAPGSSAR